MHTSRGSSCQFEEAFLLDFSSSTPYAQCREVKFQSLFLFHFTSLSIFLHMYIFTNDCCCVLFSLCQSGYLRNGVSVALNALITCCLHTMSTRCSLTLHLHCRPRWVCPRPAQLLRRLHQYTWRTPLHLPWRISGATFRQLVWRQAWKAFNWIYRWVCGIEAV